MTYLLPYEHAVPRTAGEVHAGHVGWEQGDDGQEREAGAHQGHQRAVPHPDVRLHQLGECSNNFFITVTGDYRPCNPNGWIWASRSWRATAGGTCNNNNHRLVATRWSLSVRVPVRVPVCVCVRV